MLGAAVQAAKGRSRGLVDVLAELGGDGNLVAHGRERLADQNFVREGTIRLGRVEVGDPSLECGADDLDPSCRSVAGPYTASSPMQP